MFSPVERNDAQWNAFAAANGGGFLQSWEWAAFQESLGRSVFRFRLDESKISGSQGGSSDVAAQCTVIEHALPMGKKYLYVPMGPIVRLDGDAASRYAACARALADVMSRTGGVFTRIEPPYSVASRTLSPGDLSSRGFRYHGSVQPKHSNVVALTKDEDTLLKEMHPKTRYNIRLSEKKGVTVRVADPDRYAEDMARFWSLLEETSSRDGFHTHERKYYETMLNVLSASTDGGLRVKLYLAEHEGDTLAGALVAEFGDTVTYLHGASATNKRALMAPHALHWRIIMDAKANGFAKYDLWGVAPTDEGAHSWQGITRFKRGFGGDRVEYLGAWDLPSKGVWYTLYRLARRFR